MKNLKKKLVASGVLAILALSVSPTVSNAATTTYSVDCVTLNGTDEIYYALPADTITLNLTNCAFFQERDEDGAPVDEGVPTSPAVLVPGHSYNFASEVGADGFSAEVGLINPQHLPAGELLVTTDIKMPAAPLEFLVGPGNVDGDYVLAGDEDCYLEAGDDRKHVYTTQLIKVTVAGTYTFRNVSVTPTGGYYTNSDYHPLEDSFLAVYKSFDPTKPDDNLVGCSDDLNDRFDYDNEPFVEDLGNGVTMEGHQPYFSTTLTPGVYTLVLATYDAVSAAEWAAGLSGSNAFATGESSARFELWGPVGGLELTEPEVLADTGAPLSTVQIAFAGLLILAGFLFLITARKGKQL